MDDRFLQQLKKGVLEMLVLDTVCRGSIFQLQRCRNVLYCYV